MPNTGSTYRQTHPQSYARPVGVQVLWGVMEGMGLVSMALHRLNDNMWTPSALGGTPAYWADAPLDLAPGKALPQPKVGLKRGGEPPPHRPKVTIAFSSGNWRRTAGATRPSLSSIS